MSAYRGRSSCRYCGQTVHRVTSAKGSRLPLDPQPTTESTVLVTHGVSIVLESDALDDSRALREMLHVSHLATC